LSRVADQISVPIPRTRCIGAASGKAPLMSVGWRSAAALAVLDIETESRQFGHVAGGGAEPVGLRPSPLPHPPRLSGGIVECRVSLLGHPQRELCRQASSSSARRSLPGTPVN
jgi:hypothetical protein